MHSIHPQGRGLSTLFLLLLTLLLVAPQLAAQSPAARKPWAEVSPPAIVSAGAKAGDPTRLAVAFTLVTATDGADRATVELLDSRGALVESRPVGKTKSDAKTVEFVPRASGTYLVRVQAFRTGESGPKRSEPVTVDFRLPLASPKPGARNIGRDTILLEWPAVPEAGDYLVSWNNPAKPGQGGSMVVPLTPQVGATGTSSPSAPHRPGRGRPPVELCPLRAILERRRQHHDHAGRRQSALQA